MEHDRDAQILFKQQMKRTLSDPIVRILIDKSNLTPIQFQTFLTDRIMKQNSANMKENKKNMCMRMDLAQITRGSFNRTLNQATRNIIRSIYTIFLLGYVGIFDDPTLEPFIEASNQIRSYLDRLRSSEHRLDADGARALATLLEDLKKTVENLAGVKNFKSL